MKNTISSQKFLRPFLDSMPQLFFRPNMCGFWYISRLVWSQTFSSKLHLGLLPPMCDFRVRSNRLLQNSLTFPWHLPDSIHISLTKRNNKSVNDRFYRAFLKISDLWQKWWCQQNNVKSIFEKVLIWENLCLDLANWSIYMVTGESCCLKWSFSLTLCEIPWHFSSILPNVKISLTLCKIPWQFPDLEKFYFSLTFPWRLWTLDFIIP